MFAGLCPDTILALLLPRRGRLVLLVLFTICLVALAFGIALAWQSLVWSPAPPVASSGISNPTASPQQAGECHTTNGLPDLVCTPGVVDTRVTQENIHSTICVSGYTKTVRPSTRYTDSLKVEQIKAYGYSDTALADYEEDHLIPLELGGHPTDPKNLWPEPRSGAHTATAKDGIERSLHSRVCGGLMTLAAAQLAIATNWEAA